MASELLSLEYISVIKYATLICLSPALKREILCVFGSEYDICKSRYQYCRKEQWNAVVERKGKEIIKNIELPENLENKVLNILHAIALRMLIWAEYHEGILGLNRYYSLNFISVSHFTSQGVIDRKKAAEDMIKDGNLSIKQKYKLACIYCFTSHINSFFKQIVGDQKDVVFGPEDSKWMETPEIVKFWTFEMTGTVNEYHNTRANHSTLQAAIKNGSTEAVKYAWQKADMLPVEYSHIHEVIKMLMYISEKDWIVFRDKRFDDSKESWVPRDYFLDILCFFLFNMKKTQQQNALEENIKRYETYLDTKVLEFFLSWPYQDYFLKIAAVLWKLLPEKTYAAILLQISDKIDPYRKNLLYGEERSYDYKKLLKDFWNQSPDRLKRYVFQNWPITYRKGLNVATTTGIGLLLKILSIKKFTYEDKEMIWLILGSANDEEKANLTSAEWWNSTCISLLKKEKFEIFDRLLLVLCKSEKKITEFKKNLYEVAASICSHFLRYGKFHAVKSFINRIRLSAWQERALKEKIVYCNDAIQFCWKFLLFRRYKDFEEFVNWFLPCREAAISFKRSLSSRMKEILPVHEFRSTDASFFVTRFARSKFPNREVIGEIQTGIADIFGRAICEELIAASSLGVTYNEEDSSVKLQTEFRGGQWEKVDDFLTLCLSNNEKILEFKKTFYKLSGVNVHFNLIKANQWKEAKRFFDWLELSGTEIQKLKKKTLYQHKACREMFDHLVFDHDDAMHNLHTVDLLLRWHLTDRNSVIRYQDHFFYSHAEWDEVALKKFNFVIKNYLNDLDQEEHEERLFLCFNGVTGKRKSSVFPQQKKLRLTPMRRGSQEHCNLSKQTEEENNDSCNLSRGTSQRSLTRTQSI